MEIYYGTNYENKLCKYFSRKVFINKFVALLLLPLSFKKYQKYLMHRHVVILKY